MYSTGEARNEIMIRTHRGYSEEWVRQQCDRDPKIRELIAHTQSGQRLIPREAVDLLAAKAERGRKPPTNR